MRTTVTLDADVERKLREVMHGSRKSFKQTLNAALRAGLSGMGAGVKPKPFVPEVRPMGLRVGVDPAGLNRITDDLEIDAFLEKQVRALRP